MRDEQSTGGLGRARSRGAVEAANAGAFWLRRYRTTAIPHPHLFQETRLFRKLDFPDLGEQGVSRPRSPPSSRRRRRAAGRAAGSPRAGLLRRAAPAHGARGARAVQPIEPAGPLASAPKEAHAMTVPVWGLEPVRYVTLHTAAAAAAPRRAGPGDRIRVGGEPGDPGAGGVRGDGVRDEPGPRPSAPGSRALACRRSRRAMRASTRSCVGRGEPEARLVIAQRRGVGFAEKGSSPGSCAPTGAEDDRSCTIGRRRRSLREALQPKLVSGVVRVENLSRPLESAK